MGVIVDAVTVAMGVKSSGLVVSEEKRSWVDCPFFFGS